MKKPERGSGHNEDGEDLAGYSAAIAVPLAVGLGILSAIREGRPTDRIANILTLIAISVPERYRSLNSAGVMLPAIPALLR